MSLSIPENRALKNRIAIPSKRPFGGVCTVRTLDEGAQVVSCSRRSGVVRSSQVTDVNGRTLSVSEVRSVQLPIIPIQDLITAELERFEQSRTLVAQFTSDGTTGDIEVAMGTAPFNGNIISAQVEVSEAVAGTAAIAVRTENGQSVFQGAGTTQGAVLDLEPDFVAVGLFADPLFVPASRVPLIAGEGVSLVMRLAVGVPALAVRAMVSVTLQGIGEDLSKQILLRATVPPASASAAVAVSAIAAPVAGVEQGPVGIVSALVKFNEWVPVLGPIPQFLFRQSGTSFPTVAIPQLGGEWNVTLKMTGNTATSLRTGEQLRGVRPVTLEGRTLDSASPANAALMQRRQFLTGPASAFRALPESAEAEFILDLFAVNVFRAGGVPLLFVDELGTRL